MAIARVKARVAEGGHNIPEDIIKRRYKKGLSNLVDIFIELCHHWAVINNSDKEHTLIAEGFFNGETIIHDEKNWSIINYKIR